MSRFADVRACVYVGARRVCVHMMCGHVSVVYVCACVGAHTHTTHTLHTRTQRCTSGHVCARGHTYTALLSRERARSHSAAQTLWQLHAQGVHTYKRMQMLTYNKTEMLT